MLLSKKSSSANCLKWARQLVIFMLAVLPGATFGSALELPSGAECPSLLRSIRVGLVDVSRSLWAIENDLAHSTTSAAFVGEIRTFGRELRRSQIHRYTSEISERLKSDLRFLSVSEHPLNEIFMPGTSEVARLRLVLAAYSAVLDIGASTPVRLQKLGNIARNEAGARYVYELLLVGAYPTEKKFIADFIESSPFFRGSVSIEGDPAILITSSFEKEAAKDTFTRFYRPANLSERDWFAVKPQRRLDLFASLLEQGKTAPPELIKKTSEAPDFLGPLSREGNAAQGNVVFEFRKNAYALSPDTTVREIDTLSRLLSETEGYHVHTVFEIKGEDQEILDFNRWKIQANNQMVYRGYEEGLFPTLYVGKHEVPVEPLPEIADDKFRSTLAIRMEMFGDARKRGYGKISLEIREATRKTETLRQYVRSIHRAVSSRVWKNGENAARIRPLYTPNRLETLNLLIALGIDRKIARRLVVAEPRIALPFSNFETATVFSWATGKAESLPQSALLGFENGKESFSAAMRALEKEISVSEAKSGQPELNEDIRMAIRWSLKEWAAYARPSQIYDALP